MVILRIFRRQIRSGLVVVLGLGAVGYFGAHGIFGDRGLYGWLFLSEEFGRLEQRYILNQQRLDILEHRVTLLRDEDLDLDMLDERARHVLGWAGRDEIIVFEN